MLESETALKNGEISDEKYEKFINQQQCPSTFPASMLCVNPACQHNSLYCPEYFCPVCYGTHADCQSIEVAAITELLNSKVEVQKTLMAKLDEMLHT
jgi:hypothetical protein